jgi:hypothetical protein
LPSTYTATPFARSGSNSSAFSSQAVHLTHVGLVAVRSSVATVFSSTRMLKLRIALPPAVYFFSGSPPTRPVSAQDMPFIALVLLVRRRCLGTSQPVSPICVSCLCAFHARQRGEQRAAYAIAEQFILTREAGLHAARDNGAPGLRSSALEESRDERL